MTIELLTSRPERIKGWQRLHSADRLASDPTKNLHTAGFPYPSAAFAADLLAYVPGAMEVMLDREDAKFWAANKGDATTRKSLITETKTLFTRMRKARLGVRLGMYGIPFAWGIDANHKPQRDKALADAFALMPIVEAAEEMYVSLYPLDANCDPFYPAWWMASVFAPMSVIAGKRLTVLVAERHRTNFNETIEDDARFSAYLAPIVAFMPPGGRIAHWDENEHRQHPAHAKRSAHTRDLIERAAQ